MTLLVREQRQGEGWLWVDEGGCWSLEEKDRSWLKLEEWITWETHMGLCRCGWGSWLPCWDHPTAPLNPLLLLGSPKYYKKVPGEGMPLAEDPQRRGDLYIYFEILFPKRLSPEVKTLLRSILQPQGQ